MAWHDFWGAYNNTGPYNNVVVGGSPNNSGPYGVNLQQAHSAGYGYGIEFIDNGNYNVKFNINLVPYSVSDSGVAKYNGNYVGYYDYNYFLKVSVSNNNGKSYRDIFNQKVLFHKGQEPLLYKKDWENTAKKSQYSGSFNLPTDTTHVRIELYGEEATLPHHNIFPITVIIPNFRPMAVRKNGVFKTLDTKLGKLRIRKSGKWKDIPTMSADDTGKENKGSCRIRKSGKWVGQAKVGV